MRFSTTSVLVQLDPEAALVGGGEPPQLPDELDRPVELEIGVEVALAQANVVVAERGVDDLTDLVIAEECRVELDDDVEPMTGHQCLVMSSISLGGQPWKVDRVAVPEMRGSNSWWPPLREGLGDLGA